MTNPFAHDDAAGTTLSDARDEFEEVAALCRFARAVIGGDVTEEEIVAELTTRDIEPSAEHIALVRAAMERQAGRGIPPAQGDDGER